MTLRKLPFLACLLAACGVTTPVFAVTMAEEIASAMVAPSASDAGQPATCLTDHMGMDALFRHDNAGHGGTSWYTKENPNAFRES